MSIFIQALILVIGFCLLVKGADIFVEGAAGIAKRFGIPELIIGLTIVAMGTSAPEAAVSITAAFKGNADISIGNVVGSNILNILVILGLASVIVPIAVAASTIRYEIPYMILITILLFGLGWDGILGRIDGMILWIAFLAYLGYLFYMAKKERGNPETESELESENGKVTVLKAIVMTLAGLVMIVAGSDLTVDSASNIAEFMGMSKRFIGLTIVALGTSLPELFTSVTAARKGNADIAIGNIVGSNLFNILFVLGTSSLIIPIHYAPNFRVDTVAAILAAVLLLLCCIRQKKIKRAGGILMLLGYLGYFCYIAA